MTVQAIVTLAAVAPGLVAIGVVVRWGWRVGKKIEVLHGIAAHQLQENSGTSLVDKVDCLSESMGQVKVRLKEGDERFARIEGHLGIPPEGDAA